MRRFLKSLLGIMYRLCKLCFRWGCLSDLGPLVCCKESGL